MGGGGGTERGEGRRVVQGGRILRSAPRQPRFIGACYVLTTRCGVPVQVGLSVVSFMWLPQQLAKCTFYMFLSCVLYVNIGRSGTPYVQQQLRLFLHRRVRLDLVPAEPPCLQPSHSASRLPNHHSCVLMTAPRCRPPPAHRRLGLFPSAQDYWFTANKACVPDGPGFNYTYYNTYTAIVGSFTG